MKDDPLTVAQYAENNGLLDTPGWKRLKRFVKNKKTFARMVKQAKLTSQRHGPIYQFGIRVPRNVKEALAFDEVNGNHYWKEAMEAELAGLHEYDTFEDMGKDIQPAGYKKIHTRFIFAVKHNLRHKGRMVADGHLTEATHEGAYSGVASLRSMQICILLAELNGLDIMVGNVGPAYLEALTKKKLYVIAGPEYGELEGHTLIIRKALYGVRTSGARYHERFSDRLH